MNSIDSSTQILDIFLYFCIGASHKCAILLRFFFFPTVLSCSALIWLILIFDFVGSWVFQECSFALCRIVMLLTLISALVSSLEKTGVAGNLFR